MPRKHLRFPKSLISNSLSNFFFSFYISFKWLWYHQHTQLEIQKVTFFWNWLFDEQSMVSLALPISKFDERLSKSFKPHPWRLFQPVQWFFSLHTSPLLNCPSKPRGKMVATWSRFFILLGLPWVWKTMNQIMSKLGWKVCW